MLRELPRYIKVVKSHRDYLKKGKIYKVIDWTRAGNPNVRDEQDDVSTAGSVFARFEPSTEKAFLKQENKDADHRAMIKRIRELVTEMYEKIDAKNE